MNYQGALKIVERAISANFLYIYPPTVDALRKRMANRTNDTEEMFKRRIAAAIKEIEQANNSVMFTNKLINDNLDIAIDQSYTLVEALYFQELNEIKEKKDKV